MVHEFRSAFRERNIYIYIYSRSLLGEKLRAAAFFSKLFESLRGESADNGPASEAQLSIIGRIVVTWQRRASSRLENEEGARYATVSRLLYLLDRIGCCRRVVNRAQPDETSRRVLPCFQRFVACWGSSPFIGISAHSIMGIIKEMG